MSVHDRKNLKSALESAILYLQKQGVEEARQDAWLLLEHVQRKEASVKWQYFGEKRTAGAVRSAGQKARRTHSAAAADRRGVVLRNPVFCE